MRIGLIGLGRIGAFHADTLTRHGQVDQLFVTDAVPGMAEAAATKFGATTAADSDELLASPLNAVLIVSTTPTHLAPLGAAVAAGIATFCEKPVARDPFAVGHLVAEVRRSSVPVQIGFPRRFDPAFVVAKAAFDGGELGWLSTIRSTTMDPAPPPAVVEPGGDGGGGAVKLETDVLAVPVVVGVEDDAQRAVVEGHPRPQGKHRSRSLGCRRTGQGGPVSENS